MSRVSRFNNLAMVQEKSINWRAGLYLRLSKEDNVVKNESDSISSQRALLNKFVSNNPDIKIDDYYVDDGYSGTTFDRPGFQQMLAKIKTGDINCVIVKDLSRFGRNTIESSNFIEVVFPILKVRLISLLDNVDTYLDPSSTNGLLVPFKNIMNDEYVRDLSVKVRSAQKTYMKKGLFIGSFACYGYEKCKENKHKLVVDKEASEVVKKIFDMFLSGKSINAIAKFLNAKKILTPLAYKKNKGFHYKNLKGNGVYNIWNSTSIKKILSNQIYVGDMVQGTRETMSYKNHKIVEKPIEEWFIVQDTHEAIISREDFKKVQNLLKNNKKQNKNPFKTYILSGLVKCGDCGKTLQVCLQSKKSLNENYYFRCPTYVMSGGKICTKHSIRNDKLEELVFEIVKKYIDISDDLKHFTKNTMIEKFEIGKGIEKQQIKLMNELNSLKDSLNVLYFKFKAGEIMVEDYLLQKDCFFKKISSLENELVSNCDQINKNIEFENNKFISVFAKYKGFTSLTKEMANELINKILVYENNHIEINFNFQDEFNKIKTYL